MIDIITLIVAMATLISVYALATYPDEVERKKVKRRYTKKTKKASKK